MSASPIAQAVWPLPNVIEHREMTDPSPTVGSSGSTSGTQISTQTAKQVAAANEAGSNIAVAGLPIKLSTISGP
jgi:hypothetical protein